MSISDGTCPADSLVCSRVASFLPPKHLIIRKFSSSAEIENAEGLWAGSLKPFEVKKSSGMAISTVYLSLGSNLGDRERNLGRALEALPGAGLGLLQVSSFYETEPVDYLDQPWFLNCVARGETAIEALPLLQRLREIERRAG